MTAIGGGVIDARLALRWMIVGEWRAHPARLALTALAIAIGVALGFAVDLVNGSALGAFEGAVRQLNGSADLQVRAASPLGFNEALYPRVATVPEVADASPVVVLAARAGKARLTLLGIDVIRAAEVTPSLVGIARGDAIGAGDPFASDTVFLSPAAMRATRAVIGRPITLVAAGRSVTLRVGGDLPGAGDDAMVAVSDIATAQWRFGRVGRLDRIDIKRTETGGDAVETRLARLLPPGVVIDDADRAGQRGDTLSRAYRFNLEMLALVALLTGGFLVLSAQTLSVARRLRMFALIRTLGLPRSGIVATVAIEGLAIGFVGAAIGLALGYLLAAAALARFGGDLGAGYFRAGGAGLSVDPLSAAGFFALGVATAILGSALPARVAGRAAPAVALRNAGDVIDPRDPVAWAPAAAAIALGALAAMLPPVANLPVLGFVGMALILGGGIAGMPWLARRLLAPLARRATGVVPFDLAVRHLHGAPGQAATALCGIVASTALMIAMAVMVTSFRGAVDGWLGQILSADLYLRIDGAGDLSPLDQARMRATPGVRSIAFSRQIPVTLRADRPPVVLIARPVADDGDDPSLVLIARADRLPKGTTPIWISEPAARLYRWSPGDSVSLPLPGRFAVAGIWRDYARQQGAIVIRDRDYDRLSGDTGRSEAAIMLRAGADPNAVGRRLIANAPPALHSAIDIARPALLRRFALEKFDQSFAITYLLEGVAILVGLAGVGATMSAQTIARAREFGMLRHIGVSRRQIIQMLASEGALLGLVGAVAGISLGGVLAKVLIDVINPQSFNWTMPTSIPWATIGSVAAMLIAAAAGTAVLAGRQALTVDAVRMVREDW